MVPFVQFCTQPGHVGALREVEEAHLAILSNFPVTSFVIKGKPVPYFEAITDICNLVQIVQDLIIDEIGNEPVQGFGQWSVRYSVELAARAVRTIGSDLVMMASNKGPQDGCAFTAWALIL